MAARKCGRLDANDPTSAVPARFEVKSTRRHFPSREEVLQFVSENPGKSSKRDISRAFGIRGIEKSELKRLLRQMADEGLIEKRGKRISRAGELPRVCVLDIVSRDKDGALLAVPAAWDIETDGVRPTVRIRTFRDKRGVTAGVGDRILARTERVSESGVEYVAQVMKKIDSQRNLVLGVIRLSAGAARLEPTARRKQELVIATGSLGGAGDGDLVEVKVTRSGRFGPGNGEVVNVIGNIASEKAVSLIAIHEHGIPHVFPGEVIAEAEKITALKPGDAGHQDWLDMPLVTIDPADAKDHDDAVMAEPDPDRPGGWIATVAIADVGWYVRPGTALDLHARKRGNSVYFPDRVVPMLPERISNDLCSLRQDQPRPALAVRMWFDADGRKKRHLFQRVMIRSRERLSYTQAQNAIDGTAAPLPESVLAPLWDAWRCMKRGRAARAPLELDIPERKILLKEDGSVDRIVMPERLDAHRLIEEFMIQANVCAAETLEERRQKLVYRVHDAPSRDKLENLRDFLKSLNLSLVRAGNVRASHFNAILSNVSGSDREELINQVVLRSQSQAEYSPENIGHFGLNLMRYAHFTSPIRRYADLIVHRALITALDFGEGGMTRDQDATLDVVAADISVTERRAMAAERETVDRLVAGFLSERVGERFAARINGVTRAGLFVTLSETGADGFVPISRISEEYYIFDEASHLLRGEESGLTYQLGQEVEVRLAEAAPMAGALRFEMLSDGVPVKQVARSAPGNKPRGGRQRHMGAPKFRRRMRGRAT